MKPGFGKILFNNIINIFFALRPKHWIKNFFIFLPLIFGKKLFVSPDNFYTAVAFILFSIAASSGYLINDIFDYKKDKIHPVKCIRPIASGKISIKQSWIVAAVLGILSIGFSCLLNLSFGLVVITYILLNFIYTIILKELVIIDVFCIAILFILRIIAGAVIVNVELSHWIIFMTMLLALFLGFTKRREELRLYQNEAATYRSVLSKYNIYFIDQVASIITSSNVIVYMLYTIDNRTTSYFGTNHLIYSVPFVFYGIFRYLYLINIKRFKTGDPTSIVLSDFMMQINSLLWISVCIAVIYFKL